MMDIRVDLFRRSYFIHVPENYTGTDPLPLLVVLHGAFSDGEEMEKFTGFSDLADQENFVVVYPNGIGLFNWLRHWNSGHCCGRARNLNIDDVAFVETVMDQVVDRLSINRERIYLVGHSNGGMLAYRFAAEKSKEIAAAAVVSGTIGGKPSAHEPEWRVPDPKAPVPMIIFHGEKDERIPYHGGVDPRGRSGRTWIDVGTSVRFWVSHDGCKDNPRSRSLFNGRVRIKSWESCKDRTAVRFYTLSQWGHAWPGPYFKSRFAGYPGDDFDAARIIWDFFKSYQKTRP